MSALLSFARSISEKSKVVNDSLPFDMRNLVESNSKQRREEQEISDILI